MTKLQESADGKSVETQSKILLYLKAYIAKGGRFVKAKYVAKDLGLTSKEVGTNLSILSEINDELDIAKWSYSNSTTWSITPKNKETTEAAA